MRNSIFHSVFALLAFTAGVAGANDTLPIALNGARANAAPKSILVVEFGEKAPPGSKLADAIEQGKNESGHLESLLLADERMLESTLETKADGSLGMVVLIHPRDMDTVDRVLPLYPDLYFTVIDAPRLTYAMNAQNVQFNEEAGVFLMGTIAGIATGGRVTMMTMEDDEHDRHVTEIFTKGVRYTRPDADVKTMPGMRPSSTQHIRLASAITDAFQQGTSVLFSMDNEIVEQALRAAKVEHKLVISGNPPAPDMDTSRLLTYLVKRYDLALLDVLRIYAHNQWHTGKIELGIAGGYVDYSLNADNVEVFPKDSIDRIETLKDFIGQGMYNHTPNLP